MAFCEVALPGRVDLSEDGSIAMKPKGKAAFMSWD